MTINLTFFQCQLEWFSFPAVVEFCNSLQRTADDGSACRRVIDWGANWIGHATFCASSLRSGSLACYYRRRDGYCDMCCAPGDQTSFARGGRCFTSDMSQTDVGVPRDRNADMADIVIRSLDGWSGLSHRWKEGGKNLERTRRGEARPDLKDNTTQSRKSVKSNLKGTRSLNHRTLKQLKN